jgi:hypothetical protein
VSDEPPEGEFEGLLWRCHLDKTAKGNIRDGAVVEPRLHVVEGDPSLGIGTVLAQVGIQPGVGVGAVFLVLVLEQPQVGLDLLGHGETLPGGREHRAVSHFVGTESCV